MKVREIMKSTPLTVTEVTKLGEALQTMMKHRIGALPVVDRGELVGLVTVTDVLEAEVREAMA